MKSANWNSTTGRNPTSAAPAARPVNPDSAIGGSTTRRGPNLSRKPLVTLKAPPNCPTSSPMMKTSGSASISLHKACEMASREVTWPLLVLLYTLLLGRRVGKGIRERFLARLDGFLARGIARSSCCFGVDNAVLEQDVLEQRHRVAFLPFLQHLPGHVVGWVVLRVT